MTTSTLTRTLTALAALAAGAVASTAAVAQPTGVWIDHTGRGAVEIADCGGNLCGHIVWLKDAKNAKACRTQVIGNAKPMANGTWDRGWIVDPDDNSRYSVELKPVGADRLRVVGYMGSKFFSETMTWKRAPADLKRCDGREAATPAAAPASSVLAPAKPAVAAPTEPAPLPLPIAPAEAAPQPLQRQAAAPLPLEPSAATPPAPARVAEPVTAAPAQGPRVEVDETTPEAEPERKGRRQASSKGRNRNCRVDLPYITLNYPCDAF